MSETSEVWPFPLWFLDKIICNNFFTLRVNNYGRSSHKRPPREFEKVVVTRAGCLQEYALVSDPVVKQ